MKTRFASLLMASALTVAAILPGAGFAAESAIPLEHSIDLLASPGKPAKAARHVQLPSNAGHTPTLVTNAQVGDADSFGREQVYLGLGQTQPVILASDCSGIDPTTSSCAVLAAAPAATAFSLMDLGRIELPADVTHSLLCFALTPFIQLEFNNPTGVSQTNARFSAAARIVIENPVLNDPALVDPATGLPLNGQLELDLQTYTEVRSLAVGELDLKAFEQSRSCIAGLVSRQSLIDNYGLSAAQARRFFHQPMVLRLGARGSVRLVDSLSYFYGIRLYGDRSDQEDHAQGARDR